MNSRSNYITDDKRIVVGAMPFDDKDLEEITRSANTIINLTAETPWYKTIVDKIDIRYIHFSIQSGRAPSKKRCTALIDRLLELYNKGETLYIHCNGGHGRAGTIAAILVGKMYNMDASEAISKINECRNTRQDISRNFIPTPETSAQVQLINQILGLKRGNTLPDRSDKSWLFRVRSERRSRK